MALIGAVADDYTGATDLATTLVSRGYRTRLSFGIPEVEEFDIADVDAVVIGLKIRSVPAPQAVADAISAVRTLRTLGCTQIYDKYCATFDSTPEGNIGPVLDALLDELDCDRTVVVLPFPEAGRTVFNGHLFVDGVPLDESSMRDHPLTPMRDSRILRLLGPQTRRQVAEIRLPTVAAGVGAVTDALAHNGSSISVVDAITRSDLDTIAAAVADLPLVSGGAGLAASFRRRSAAGRQHSPAPSGGFAAILAGSASAENQRQIAQAAPLLPSRKLCYEALRRDFRSEIDDLTGWAVAHWRQHPQRPVLLYSVGGPDDIDLGDHPDGEATSALTERTLAECARALVGNGARRLIVAGGETSGSVTAALGISTFTVGAPLSPGVAWAATRDPQGRELAILLKSGSLGTPDIFTAAWSALEPG